MGWPHVQVLNVPIACWWYVSGKPSSLSSTDAWVKSITSMAMLGEKFRWVPRATQLGWEVELVAPFLESSSIHLTLSMTRERLPRTGTAHRKRTLGICGLTWEVYMSCWLGFPLQGVHWFKSPWLLDMGTACLCQSSRSKLTNLMRLI
jgi:hypothetical protein